MEKLHVTVWNEFFHEKREASIAKIYPEGIHGAIAAFLGKEADLEVTTATLDMPEHGLTEEVLNNTDVLIWWGHMAHEQVSDEIVERVYQRIQQGMGLIVLHSGHASKIFHKICGTNSLDLKWRESGDKEILWVVNPTHPIVQGLNEKIVLEQEETYGEHFNIPTPDELVFISWYSGGEVFRSGCCYHRGNGKIFYFKPGHEAFPIYYNPEIQKVIVNAIHWAAPAKDMPKISYGHYPNPPALD